MVLIDVVVVKIILLIVFVCHVIWEDHMTRELEPLKANHHSVKFGVHKHGRSEDTKVA